MPSLFELLPIFQQRVWGRRSLAPLFPDRSDFHNRTDTSCIGEVWFSFSQNATSEGEILQTLLESHPEWLGSGGDAQHPGVCPILVKLLFTSERLSVQVHPDDVYAQQHHGSLGKTEAWYVVAADPPGEVAVGFREQLSTDQFRSSIQSGEIERLLDWRKVNPGDTIFTPAGTVHAIGAGLTVCEIQENSDITYRLFDYGRPRELHVDHGSKVAHLGPHRHDPKPIMLGPGRDELVACPYFRIERLRPTQSVYVPAALATYAILICIGGSGTIGGQPVRAGQAFFLPAGGTDVRMEAPGSEWILTYKADAPLVGAIIQ